MNRQISTHALCSLLLVALVVLTGCQGPAATLAAVTPLPSPAVAPTDTPPPTATSLPSATPAPTETPLPPTATPAPPTETPLPPTATPPPTETPTLVPPTETPSPAAALKKPSLNVRSGPGTAYPVVGALRQGDTAAVTGRSGDCAWLQVTTPKGLTGWIVGGADYVTLNVACASLPEAKAPPPPTPAPTRPKPAATPTAAAAAEPVLPADKGCFLFTSYIGDKLLVTLTNAERGWNFSFDLSPMGEYFLCMDPGHYTYTISHPNWLGNGEFSVEAGKHGRFPIVGRS